MTTSTTDPPAKPTPDAGGLTHDMIHEAVGDIGDAAVAAIIETGATLEQFEEAAALAAGESDVVSASRMPPDPAVQAVYEILTVNQAYEEDRP